MKKSLFAMMMLSACTEAAEVPTVEEPIPSIEVGEAPHLEDEPVAPAVAPAEAPAEEDAVPVEAPVAVAVRPRSAVEEAPSFYMDYFSEMPRIRREAHSRFSRVQPEEMNLRGNNALRDATVLVLSRLCLSEANWLHDPHFDHAHPEQNHAELDCPAIYRVLRRTRSEGETLLGAMRRHSHYVTEERTPRGPRMRWIVELQLGGSRPHSFPATDRDGNALNWDRDYQPRWLEMQEFVRDLLRGEHLGICADAPIITWGGRCDVAGGACDDHLAVRRGLVPYERCGATANRFWCRPGTVGCPESSTTEELTAVDDSST